jgi:hypothetical protein
MATNFYNNPSFSDTPYGLKLQQTITSSGSVTVPPNIKRVYAICVGGGGGGGTSWRGNVIRVTAISGDGTTITYTCDNDFVVGMTVTVTGSNITGYNVTNATIATVSSTNFTVTNATIGTHTATNVYATASTVTTNAVAGGTITAITPSSPSTGFVTYSTNRTVPVGSSVTVNGSSISGYNGTRTVTHSTPGTSFSVGNLTTGTPTGTITFVGVATYTAANNYPVGAILQHSGHSPSSFNINNALVTAASPTSYTISDGTNLSAATTWTSGGASTWGSNVGIGAGGGGAGGYSAGWTMVPSTCTVGAGGAGGTNTVTISADKVTGTDNFFGYTGSTGNTTSFGFVYAGGGKGGAGTTIIGQSAVVLGGPGSAGGGVSRLSSANAPGNASYTGAPGSDNQVSYAGSGGGTTGSPLAGRAGVSGGGGSHVNVTVTSSYTGLAGGSGMIGGGGGSAPTVNPTNNTGGAGGTGDLFNGGTGSTGNLIGGGAAGGGGGGLLGQGGNASGNTGGTGGDGGGGGGAGVWNGVGGNGGNGVIYLYY